MHLHSPSSRIFSLEVSYWEKISALFCLVGIFYFILKIQNNNNNFYFFLENGALFFMSEDFSLREINRNVLFKSMALMKNKLYSFTGNFKIEKCNYFYFSLENNELFEFDVSLSNVSQSKIYKLHSWVKQPNLMNSNQNKMIVIIFSKIIYFSQKCVINSFSP